MPRSLRQRQLLAQAAFDNGSIIAGSQDVEFWRNGYVVDSLGFVPAHCPPVLNYLASNGPEKDSSLPQRLRFGPFRLRFRA